MKVKDFANTEIVKEKTIIIDWDFGAKEYKSFDKLPKKYLESEIKRRGTYGHRSYCFII